MARRNRLVLAKAVLDGFGRTFAEELGIRIELNTPAELFKTVCFAMLSAKRISHKIAMSAAKALFDQGWTTARKMSAAEWRDRTATLNQSGYARYDESTSRMLGETSQMIVQRYGGDLRRLRQEAGFDTAEERRLLKEFKGLGDVGVDIFLREVQVAWDEVFPFADRMALRAARTLGLGNDAQSLRRLVDDADFARFVAGLVRIQLEDGFAEVAQAAA